jgi:hypothetical protein
MNKDKVINTIKINFRLQRVNVYSISQKEYGLYLGEYPTVNNETVRLCRKM